MALKDPFIRAIWGHGLYRRLLRPFDRWHTEPVSTREFDGPPPLNKVCRTADAADADWRRGYADLGFPDDRSRFHRKVWEFNQALYGLRKLRRLAPEATALGIGCGHEEFMYFLANRLRLVVATDLYEGTYLGGESHADVLEHPAKYAPFPYREDHLQVRRMNGLALEAAPASFDMAFCLSSIEHFGSLADKRQALAEMFRVLKPGGVAVVTTEIVLNRLGRGAQYFQPAELQRLVGEVGFTLDSAPDLRVEREFAHTPLALPMDTFTVPHVVLRNFHTIYTSVALFLMKPGEATRPHAIVGDEVAPPIEPFRYGADLAPESPRIRVTPGQPLATSITVRNTGNHPWFTGASHSHMVRVGAWFADADGRSVSGEPARFGLPRDLRPGDAATIALALTAPPAPANGRLSLRVALVKELCFWFRDKGVPDVEIRLDYDEQST